MAEITREDIFPFRPPKGERGEVVSIPELSEPIEFLFLENSFSRKAPDVDKLKEATLGLLTAGYRYFLG